jgi:hypothetical protein
MTLLLFYFIICGYSLHNVRFDRKRQLSEVSDSARDLHFAGGVLAESGHGAKDCPKSTSSAAKAKARAAQVKEKETPDAKKG